MQQTPAGQTSHAVVTFDAAGNRRLVHEFVGVTQTDDVLVVDFAEPLAAVRRLRVETIVSASWVAWQEVRVFGYPVNAEDFRAPPTAVACQDDSDFVADVTIPDNARLAPSTEFVKTWRLRNSGTCAWDESYQFVHIEGDLMGGPPSLNLEGYVLPDQEANISVTLRSPSAAATYTGRWQLRNDRGELFGTRPFVKIVVAREPPRLRRGSPDGMNLCWLNNQWC